MLMLPGASGKKGKKKGGFVRFFELSSKVMNKNRDFKTQPKSNSFAGVQAGTNSRPIDMMVLS